MSSRVLRVPRDTGTVLVVVMLVMITLLGLGLTGLFLTNSAVRMSTNINFRNQALVVAEAGLERAQQVLNDPSRVPNIPALLAGSHHPQDDVPTTPDECDVRRGAIFVADLPLANVTYPSISRTSDLPPGHSQTVTATMGTFTVYVRQDLADCRIGNFTCDYAPDASACSPPENLPVPNGAIVLRSEGTASDGRSRVVLEATLSLALGRTGNPLVPIDPLCSTGQSGCDDNSSTVSGIVVDSPVTQHPPNPGTGGSPGAGGTTNTGGSLGTGGSGGNSTTVVPGYGGSGTGGTGTGGTGTGGTGTGGTGTGSSGTGGSRSTPCLAYAVSAVAPCGNPELGCITVNYNSNVDGFDRASGPYGPSNHSPTDIAMTCSAWSNPCPSNCTSGCISGQLDYGVSQNLTTSTLPVPSHSSNSSTLSVPPSTDLWPSGSTLYYHEIDLDGGTLTLHAGDYVVDNFNLNSGTLYIDDSAGPVRLWVTGFVAPNSAVTVKSGNPSSFWLIYDGTSDVNNNSGNSFTGVLFAPGAHVNLNYHVTGAVVGGHVTLNSGSYVHFDTNLRCP